MPHGRKRASLEVDTVCGGDRALPAASLPAAAAVSLSAAARPPPPLIVPQLFLRESPVAAAAMYQQLAFQQQLLQQQQLAYHLLQAQAHAQVQAHAQQQQQQQQQQQTAQTADYELLEDFCTYLESRVLTKNLPLLRRVVLEFLACQEQTITHFKRSGANLIALLPFEVADASTRQRAALLLHKQRGQSGAKVAAAVFDFLHARVATKNLDLFKRFFAEFRVGSEEALANFIKLGSAAVSVIPCEPVRAPAPLRDSPSPPKVPLQHQLPPHQVFANLQHAASLLGYPPQPQQQHLQQLQQYMYQHVQHPPYADPPAMPPAQERPTSEPAVPGVTPKHDRAKKIPTSHHVNRPAARKLSAHSNATSTTEGSESDRAAADVVVRPGKRVVRKPVLYSKEQEEESTSKRSKTSKCELSSDSDDGDDGEERGDDGSPNDRPVRQRTSAPPTRAKSARKTASGTLPPRRRDQRSAGGAGAGDGAAEDAEREGAACQDKSAATRMTGESVRLLMNEKKAPRARGEGGGGGQLGKSCHRRQCSAEAVDLRVAIRDRMLAYEDREPWKQIYHNLPAPFDRADAPELADRLQFFWVLHARAVWERNFWAPLAPDGDSRENLARKARQQSAQGAFEALIRDAFERFGAGVFVQLDAQRHPGWWYRRAIVDIHSLHKIVGAEQCWRYVETQLTARFPNCGLSPPLPGGNSGVLGVKTASDSMWTLRAFAAPIGAAILAAKKVVRAQEDADAAIARSIGQVLPLSTGKDEREQRLVEEIARESEAVDALAAQQRDSAGGGEAAR